MDYREWPGLVLSLKRNAAVAIAGDRTVGLTQCGIMYVFLSKVQTPLGKASSFNENEAPSWLLGISQLPFTTLLVLRLSIHGVLWFANPGAVVMHCAGSLLQQRFPSLLVHCCAMSVRKQEHHSFVFVTRNVNC